MVYAREVIQQLFAFILELRNNGVDLGHDVPGSVAQAVFFLAAGGLSALEGFECSPRWKLRHDGQNLSLQRSHEAVWDWHRLVPQS